MTMWQAAKAAGWSDRLLLAACGFALAASMLRLALWLLVGFLGGGWDWWAILHQIGTATLAYIAGGYVYWRQRALAAEKPLPANQVVTTYPTVGAADIARMVEERQRAERLAYGGLA